MQKDPRHLEGMAEVRITGTLLHRLQALRPSGQRLQPHDGGASLGTLHQPPPRRTSRLVRYHAMTDTEYVVNAYLDREYKAGRLDFAMARNDLMVIFKLPPVRASELFQKWARLYTKRTGGKFVCQGVNAI